MRAKDQVRLVNVNERECADGGRTTPVAVELYLLGADGAYDAAANEEFVGLLDNHRFEYRSNVRSVPGETVPGNTTPYPPIPPPQHPILSV